MLSQKNHDCKNFYEAKLLNFLTANWDKIMKYVLGSYFCVSESMKNQHKKKYKQENNILSSKNNTKNLV